jgi:putative ABC transport system substrate-binding protein
LGELRTIIGTFAAEPNGGLVAIPSATITAKRDLIASLANRNHLPTISAFRNFSAAGGLASYGVDNVDLFRRSASYIDRVFKGEKPSDLPVQEANKFQLIINAQTAKVLGLTVPPALLAAADEVIE